jgi:hypothetical protein
MWISSATHNRNAGFILDNVGAGKAAIEAVALRASSVFLPGSVFLPDCPASEEAGLFFNSTASIRP